MIILLRKHIMPYSAWVSIRSLPVYVSVGVFFDLTVSHDILLQKLDHYGIRGMQLHWFKSYFTGRSQYVCCKEASSSIKIIRHGVPQGSILGPILFLIYINELPNVSHCLYFVLFADDTNDFYSHKSLDALIQTINAENRLTVNFDKTSVTLSSLIANC